MAEMNTALKAQGQRTLVIGNREALNNDATRSSGVTVTRYANAVTSNADGSVGYQLEGDLPRAQSSTRMCVVARLTNIRLIDARLPVAKPLSLFGPSFDAEMRQKEKIGTRPMVIADTVHRNADGSTRSGLPMIIFWNGGQRSASIYALRGENKPVMLVLMGDTDYTPYALQILDARRPSS
ncbi:hypothetical protein [Sphingomonas sp.]|uniref:hypothetical protein n=1 Tax=Sphingomonas sp. TaxID=28214 RepID=UPI001B2891B1|nr:hypothetical protein [Sphingomonas sp.]MBO9712690.1 hypothetical protein [Sphingomonas sp.]